MEAAIRASDDERERTATLLRDHARSGRLTLDELSERLDATYAARTCGELDALLADLPLAERAAPPRKKTPDGVREHAWAYVLVNALMLVIWAATGAGYFWPVWPAMGWGIGLLSHAAACRDPRVSGKPHR